MERRTKLCQDALRTSVLSWAVQSLMTMMTSKGACDRVSQAECEAVTVIKLRVVCFELFSQKSHVKSNAFIRFGFDTCTF